MPGGKHLPGASAKRNRQYEHIREQYEAEGNPRAKEIAARTVNKQRTEEGETEKAHKLKKGPRLYVKLRKKKIDKDLEGQNLGTPSVLSGACDTSNPSWVGRTKNA